MDEDGFFYIVDRLKDIIIVSGLNVVPREVEDVLYEHPAVREVVVAGIPDAYRGESVKAFVVLQDGETATAEALIAFCAERLARFKIPAAIEFRAELPKTTVGKPLRRALVAESVRGCTRRMRTRSAPAGRTTVRPRSCPRNERASSCAGAV